MIKLVFLVATYNEEKEIVDLLNSVMDLADYFVISDDGSTDRTIELANIWSRDNDKEIYVIRSAHTGLPETVKKFGVQAIEEEMGPDTWILMLDADERIPLEVQDNIDLFLNSKYSDNITHVWFNLQEYINNKPTRGFLKCRLFRAGAIRLSDTVHEDDHFDGQGANFNWFVIHRKTEAKQRMREKEYIQTYKKLLKEGKVSQEWVDRCIGYHYFEKE